MKFVVSGGAGFIGRALCDALLLAGNQVTCLDRADRLAWLSGSHPGLARVPYVFGDEPCPVGIFSGAEALVHLAHRGLPGSAAGNWIRDAELNVRGSLDLFEKAEAEGVISIIYASSGGTVYGQVGGGPVTEDVRCAPISHYGASKLAIEQYLRYFAARGSLSAVSLRIGNAVGPGQFAGAGVGAVAKFLGEVAAGRSLSIWGSGETVRDYLYIDDIVDAFARASRPEFPSGEYNVGTGTGFSLNELVQLIVSVTGVSPNVIYHDSREFDVPAIVLDSSKFRAVAGWCPTIDLRTAVARLWESVQQGEGFS